MKKKYLFTIFVIIGLVFGILVATQFRTDVPVGNLFLTDEVSAREELFNEYLNEQSYLQGLIVLLREQIEQAQFDVTIQGEQASFSSLESLKGDIGLSEVFGKGLEITLDDSPMAVRDGIEASDVDLVQASDIRDIVNILNASNADGISVNNHRVVATSPISAVGTTILVNNSHIAPPFVIEAVGDTEIMLQRLLNTDLLPSLYERTSKGHLKMKVAVKEKIVLSIYNGDLKDNYLTLVN